MNRFAQAGLVVWIIHTGIVVRSPFDVRWAEAILLLAAFVLVPLATNDLPFAARLFLFGAAGSLITSFAFDPSPLAALLALPWLLGTTSLAFLGLIRGMRHWRSLPHLTGDVGFLYIAVGGAWTVASRCGFRPLDFKPIIVFLTAIHFHYAGFALPILAGRTQRPWACAGAIAGVPLVALGITLTQLKCGPQVETLAGLVMAVTAMTDGILYLSDRSLGPRFARMMVGGCLLTGGFLACCYALRFVLPMAWLDIPIMRATHGTANALGCVLGLWAASPTERTNKPNTQRSLVDLQGSGPRNAFAP